MVDRVGGRQWAAQGALDDWELDGNVHQDRGHHEKRHGVVRGGEEERPRIPLRGVQQTSQELEDC